MISETHFYKLFIFSWEETPTDSQPPRTIRKEQILTRTESNGWVLAATRSSFLGCPPPLQTSLASCSVAWRPLPLQTLLTKWASRTSCWKRKSPCTSSIRTETTTIKTKNACWTQRESICSTTSNGFLKKSKASTGDTLVLMKLRRLTWKPKLAWLASSLSPVNAAVTNSNAFRGTKSRSSKTNTKTLKQIHANSLPPVHHLFEIQKLINYVTHRLLEERSRRQS